MNATARLYYDDAYLTHFDARVTDARAENGACWLALDRSAFYPTSGGQPYDTGTLTDESGAAARVTDVTVTEGVVWHKTDAALPVGARVRGEIDWPRRLDHMQQHAADHLLAGALWQMCRGVTIGLHMGDADSTIDVDLPGGRTHLTNEEIDALERTVNTRVQRDDPIRCWFPGSVELAALPLRKKPTVTEHVRVVAMGDYEMVACGGTHPATTGQLGVIKVLSAAPARGKMRLCFVAGMRAVAYFQRCARASQEVSSLLSATVDTAREALLRERENAQNELRALKIALQGAALAQASAALTELPGRARLCAVHIPYADRQTLVRAASDLIARGGGIALLSCPDKDARALVFARSTDVSADMSALLRACGARGGGRPDMAQGSAADDGALLRAESLLNEYTKP